MPPQTSYHRGDWPHRQPRAKETRRRLNGKVYPRVALFIFLLYAYFKLANRLIHGHTNQQVPTQERTFHQEAPKQDVPAPKPAPFISKTRFRVCAIVRGLHDLHGGSPAGPSPLGYLEVFEYLGLDPSAAPFHPPSSMAGPGRPNYSASRAAIHKAWVSRIRDMGIVETTPCEEECEATKVANAKEAFLTGRMGETVFEEGIVHTLAGMLLEDETRAEYVNYVLPVLRPPAPSRFSWGSGAVGLESVCPEKD